MDDKYTSLTYLKDRLLQVEIREYLKILDQYRTGKTSGDELIIVRNMRVYAISINTMTKAIVPVIWDEKTRLPKAIYYKGVQITALQEEGRIKWCIHTSSVE